MNFYRYGNTKRYRSINNLYSVNRLGYVDEYFFFYILQISPGRRAGGFHMLRCQEFESDFALRATTGQGEKLRHDFGCDLSGRLRRSHPLGRLAYESL